MTAAYRTSSAPAYIVTGGGASFAITVPGDVAEGDLGFIFVGMVSGQATDTVSSPGWTVLQSPFVVGTMTYAVLYRARQAGDSSTVTVTLSPAARLTTAQGYWWSGAGTPVLGTRGTRAGGSGSSTTTIAPAVATTEANELCIALAFERTTATETDITSVTGATKRGFAAESGTSTCTIAVADQVASSSPSAPATFTYPNAQATNGVAVQIAVPAAAAPTPTLVRPGVQGMPDAERLRVTSRTTNTTAVRLAVSTSDTMAAPVYGAAVLPDSDGYAHVECGGLAADTDQWWQLELDGQLVGDIGLARTLPAEGELTDFSFLAMSCAFTGSNDGVFTAARTRTSGGRRALFAAHLGDMHYNWSSTSPNGNTAPNDVAQIRAAYEQALSAPNQAALYRDTPLAHCWSDNDFAGSNSDSTYAARPAVQSAWRQIMSYPTLPDTAGIYRSWVVGRVRFILTDSRSYMSSKNAADSSSKTMLGATQKQWLKDRLADPEPVKVWLNDSKWPGPPITAANTGIDYPAAFPTERAEIADYITANGLGERLLYIAGDIHALACDDGTNNPYASFPFCHIAPLDQQTQAYPHTVQQTYPPAGDTSNTTRHEYGWFDVTDSGTEISIAFTGYTSDGTERVSLARTWSALETSPATIAGPPVEIEFSAPPGGYAAGVAVAGPTAVADLDAPPGATLASATVPGVAVAAEADTPVGALAAGAQPRGALPAEVVIEAPAGTLASSASASPTAPPATMAADVPAGAPAAGVHLVGPAGVDAALDAPAGEPAASATVSTSAAHAAMIAPPGALAGGRVAAGPAVEVSVEAPAGTISAGARPHGASAIEVAADAPAGEPRGAATASAATVRAAAAALPGRLGAGVRLLGPAAVEVLLDAPAGAGAASAMVSASASQLAAFAPPGAAEGGMVRPPTVIVGPAALVAVAPIAGGVEGGSAVAGTVAGVPAVCAFLAPAGQAYGRPPYEWPLSGARVIVEPVASGAVRVERVAFGRVVV